MDFSRIFDVFSQRPQPLPQAAKPLTTTFKHRVVFLCRDNFDLPLFWQEIHQKLQYLHGRQFLSAGHSSVPVEDTIGFLNDCSDDHFLDFVELIFKSHLQESISHGLVGPVNEFLRLDDLPYVLTDFVWVTEGNAPYRSWRREGFPQIIRRENEAIHKTAIEPTLALLKSPIFSSANNEFLQALADYRKDDYMVCVVKCGSAFESVMKIICARKAWSYQQTDTAEPLLTTIVEKTRLEPFFKQPLMLIATTRNRLSSAHGAGTEPRDVPKHVAQYTINATASAILLLVEEANP